MERIYQVIIGRSRSSSPVLHSAFDEGGSSIFCFYLFCLLCFLLLSSVASAAEFDPGPDQPKPAQVKISGYGLLGNRQLKRILTTLELGGKKPEFFDASFVEDAALILTSRVKRDGYLKPKTIITIYLDNGTPMQVDADKLLENPLPRPLRITRVHFRIHKGVLYYYSDLQFEGLETLTEKQARSYFMETAALLHPKRSKIYAPERVKKGTTSITDELDRQGFQDAAADYSELSRNDKTGAVSVRIIVRQGSKYIVESVREEFYYETNTAPKKIDTVKTLQAYSKTWQQDFGLSLKTNYYHLGYRDTKVEWQTINRTPRDNAIYLELLAKILTGTQVRIGVVEFHGQKKTKESLMSRRVRVQRGELLDPIRTEEGRYRLAQLGAFDTVDLTYRNEDAHTRDVIYNVKEGRSLQVSLLFGYGSYELLRGGVQANMYNLWGRAHQMRLKVIQSFKASSGEFNYSIPEFGGHDFDVFANGTGLRREEPSFTRIEYGGGVGAHKYFKEYSTDLMLRYNYQILHAQSIIPAIASEGLTNPAVGAIIVDLKFDRRDNPLYPRKGYKAFANFETATEYLGGDANYERVEITPSWHIPVGEGHWFNFGFSHGVDITFGSPAHNLPFNRRFFPGGSSSIRGYNEDEASPRNASGQIVGAETYTLATVEFEQALTPAWTVVVFSDNLGFAHRLEHYPFDTGLFSVGGGLRWKTIIGPIRLEYGYNLNPRPKDPMGTLQFSLGFPF